MIEVNLLPGAKRSKKGGGGLPSINFAAIGSFIAARVQDKWLAAALIAAIVVGGGIAFAFTTQQARSALLNNSAEKAVADSTRYATVLNERARLEARRDSALLQLNIIKAIDEDRFIWSHVLQEVSEALPQYTWLQIVNYTGTAQGVNPPAAYKPPPADTSRGRRRQAPLKPFVKDSVRVRIVGRTVDIQAMTRFMRSLEDSPFLGSVTLNGSEIAIENGKEVTQFTLEVLFTRPDTMFLRRSPLTLSQR